MITAKYLPVEGEIKDGDKIIHIKGDINTAILKDGVMCIDTEEYSGAIGLDRYKVVQLHAVTQDIEGGDEVWDLFKAVKHGIAEEVHEDFIKLKDVSYTMDRKSGGAVKVLSPISPKAIWVKEGDEIEILLSLVCPVCDYVHACLHDDKKRKELALVKCQCNTYH